MTLISRDLRKSIPKTTSKNKSKMMTKVKKIWKDLSIIEKLMKVVIKKFTLKLNQKINP